MYKNNIYSNWFVCVCGYVRPNGTNLTVRGRSFDCHGDSQTPMDSMTNNDSNNDNNSHRNSIGTNSNKKNSSNNNGSNSSDSSQHGS